jgi:putative transposase
MSLKKALKPAIKRELVGYLTSQFMVSTRQACRTLSLSRTVYFYQPDTRRDEPVIHALTELAERYPRYGLRSCSSYCAGKATPGTTNACTGFTVC